METETFFTLLDAQKKFLEVEHNYDLDVALYQGGYGSGKTFSGALLGIILCLKYPKIKGLVGAQTFPLLRDTTLKTYMEHLDLLQFAEGRDYWFKVSTATLTFANGSTILFRHLEDANKIKSLNLHFAEIEEMSDVPHSTFNMLMGRLRAEKRKEWSSNFKYRLFGHTNPEQNKGWIYKTFVEGKKENYRLIIAPTTQNIYLPNHFVDELASIYDANYYKINVLGQFGNYTSGLIVKDFSDENIRALNYQDDIDLHITCDFNVDPMCWCLAHKVNGKIYFFDEIVIENTTTGQTCNEFLSRYSKHKGKIIVNGDASGDNRSCTSEYTNYAIMLNILRAHFGEHKVEIDIRSYNPPIIRRIAAFNAKICNTQGERNLFIDKKCKWLLHNIYNLQYKTGTTIIDLPTFNQVKNNRENKFLMHPFDAASYLVEVYYPIKIN